MARNYEKRFSGLNRFLEAKQREAKGGDLERPPLHRLHTANEVKKWIPSIRREVEYLLQQISSPHESRNYSDQKIEEFKQQIDELKREHQKFVAKVQKLDPSYKDIIPWQPRGYSRKRSHDSLEPASDTSTTGSASKKLCSPLLEKEQQERSHGSHVTIINPETSKYNYNPLGLEYSSSEDES